MFITSKNKYLSNDMKIFGTCSIPLSCVMFLHEVVLLVYFSRQGDFTIVPVMVGSLSPDKEHSYGSIFSKYLSDPDNLFVISSDFCHWGMSCFEVF